MVTGLVERTKNPRDGIDITKVDRRSGDFIDHMIPGKSPFFPLGIN